MQLHEIVHPAHRHEIRTWSRAVRRLDPKLDVVFRAMLSRERRLLVDMLQSVLARNVGVARILDADVPGDGIGDKDIELDIHALLDDGSRADVEMQNRATAALTARVTYYTARDYTTQIVRGDDYRLLKPTVTIVWMTEPLFPTIDRLHSIFSFREDHTHESFGGHLTIHLLQLSMLSCLPPLPSTSYAARTHRWARFLMASSDAELDQLASEDPIMSLARRTLDDLSQDPDARRRADRRFDEIMLYQNDLLTERMEGEAKGRAALLLKQLGLRFGPISEAVRVRVTTATIDQLDGWAERVLTAQTLDEALRT